MVSAAEEGEEKCAVYVWRWQLMHSGIDEGAILKENMFGRRCQHNKFIVDEQLGTVECGICGEMTRISK